MHATLSLQSVARHFDTNPHSLADMPAYAVLYCTALYCTTGGACGVGGHARTGGHPGGPRPLRPAGHASSPRRWGRCKCGLLHGCPTGAGAPLEVSAECRPVRMLIFSARDPRLVASFVLLELSSHAWLDTARSSTRHFCPCCFALASWFWQVLIQLIALAVETNCMSLHRPYFVSEACLGPPYSTAEHGQGQPH